MRPLTFAELINRGSLIVNDGYRTKTSEHGRPGFPILRVAEVSDGSIRPTFDDHVRAEYKGKIGSKLSQAGDILLTTKGTVGRRAIMPPATPPFVYSPQLCFFRVLDESIDPRWLYYWLGSEAFWAQATGISQQTDMAPYISLRDLRQVEIVLPPIEVQRCIAATLGAFDDKIESNWRARELGEELIRAHVYMALSDADGAEVATLGEYCQLIKDGIRQADLSPEEPYFGLEHMPRGSIWLSDWGTAEGLGSNKSRFQMGDVLFGKLRPYFKKVGLAPVSGVCSTDILVLRPLTGHDRALVATVASSDSLIESISASATGTRMPRASWSDLSAWPIPKLNLEQRMRLGAVTNPIIDRMMSLTTETRGLIALRDVFLPQLLSGRVRVPEALEAIT